MFNLKIRIFKKKKKKTNWMKQTIKKARSVKFDGEKYFKSFFHLKYQEVVNYNFCWIDNWGRSRNKIEFFSEGLKFELEFDSVREYYFWKKKKLQVDNLFQKTMFYIQVDKICSNTYVQRPPLGF